jgi:hypothetical protein
MFPNVFHRLVFLPKTVRRIFHCRIIDFEARASQPIADDFIIPAKYFLVLISQQNDDDFDDATPPNSRLEVTPLAI